MADPEFRGWDGFCWVGEVKVKVFKEFEEADSKTVFVNGDVGKDIGEDNWRGDVGVPRLEGRDILESELLVKEFFIGSVMSDGSGVQNTVGKDMG